MLLPAVLDERRGVPQRILRLPLLASLGLVSYGIYLWHQPLVEPLEAWLNVGFVGLTVVTVVVAIVCGTTSYYVLERRALRLATRLDRIVDRRVV